MKHKPRKDTDCDPGEGDCATPVLPSVVCYYTGRKVGEEPEKQRPIREREFYESSTPPFIMGGVYDDESRGYDQGRHAGNKGESRRLLLIEDSAQARRSLTSPHSEAILSLVMPNYLEVGLPQIKCGSRRKSDPTTILQAQAGIVDLRGLIESHDRSGKIQDNGQIAIATAIRRQAGLSKGNSTNFELHQGWC